MQKRFKEQYLPPTITAQEIVRTLKAARARGEDANVRRFFRGNDDGSAPDNRIMGVAFGKVFAVAKKFRQAPLAEIEKLLESRFYEARMAFSRSTPPACRGQRFGTPWRSLGMIYA